MNKQLWIIEYENAHWCGGELHCVVWAEDETEAEDLAAEHMEQEQRELFDDHYSPSWDDGDDHDLQDMDNEQAYSVVSVEPLIGSEFEVYYNDPVQRENFYPCVNPENAV